MRNIYDNSEFFAAYAEMGRSKDGLKIIVNFLPHMRKWEEAKMV